MKKIKVITIISGIVLTIILVLGSSYALFYSESNFTNEETYTTGILDIELVDEEGYNTSLTLSNSLPMTDEEGKQTTPFKLKLRNVGNLSYTFDVKLINTTTENSINPNYIKVMIDDNEPVTLGSLTDSIIASNITLNPEEEKVIEVRIWLDISTPNSEIGKTFTGKITTEGIGSEYVPPQDLLLDISQGSITIDEGSDSNKLYVTGGGFTEQVEIDNTLPIIITGTAPAKTGITVNGGTSNITLSDVNIIDNDYSTTSFEINNGTINLNLAGENTLSTYEPGDAPLLINNNATLIIDGEGSLSTSGYSGIATLGTLIINGGNINATTEYTSGAGIALYGDSALLEINDGNITAIGGTGVDEGDGIYFGGGAGIGGTINTSVTGTIRINGGTIYAQGGGLAAGIGGGGADWGECNQHTAPNIYISDNANVTAINGGGGAEDIGNGASGC